MVYNMLVYIICNKKNTTNTYACAVDISQSVAATYVSYFKCCSTLIKNDHPGFSKPSTSSQPFICQSQWMHSFIDFMVSHWKYKNVGALLSPRIVSSIYSLT